MFVCVCVWGGILLSVRPYLRPSVRLSIRPSVTHWLFLNILKTQWLKFIQFFKYFDIDKMFL